MNWTGGRLSRHSRANQSSVKNKQKQHFARVRNSVPNGFPKQSPAKWSIFENIQHTIPLEDSPQIVRFPDNAISKFDTTEEIASLQSPDYTSRKLAYHPQEVKSSGIKGYNVDNIDIYVDKKSTVNIQRERKRKRQESFSASQIHDTSVFPRQSESLQEMRQGLLRKGDWVGINIQRPLHLKFSSQKEKESMGMRRHIQERSLNRGQRNFRRSPVLPVEEELNGVGLQPNGHHSRSLRESLHAKNDVRIYIAGKEVRAGVSSSTTNKDRGTKLRHPSSQPASSDVMLLDGDGRSLSLFEDNSTNIRSDDSLPSLILAKEYIPNETTSRDKPASRSNLFRKSTLPHGKPSGQIRVSTPQRMRRRASLPRSDHVYSLENSPRGGTSDTQHLYYMQGALQEDENSQSTISESALRPTSQISLHHPVPQTSRVSQILYSTSPIATETTEEVRYTPPPLLDQPRSLDEDIWRSWFQSPVELDNGQSIAEMMEEPNLPEQVDSQVGTFLSTHVHLPRSTSVNGSRDEIVAHNSNVGYIARQAAFNTSQHGNPVTPNQPASEEIAIIPKEVRRKLGPLPSTFSHDNIVKLPRRDADPDAAWKQFIFAYDAGDELDNFPTHERPLRLMQPTSDATNMSLAPLRSSGESLRLSPKATQVNSHPGTVDASDSSEVLPVVGVTPDSVAAQPATTSREKSLAFTSSPPLPRRKMIFTRPTPFRSGSTHMMSTQERSPVYIGRRQGSQSQAPRDIYSFPSEDTESIEDD